jgi:C4-dicarboxylate transporter, DctQ subunit
MKWLDQLEEWIISILMGGATLLIFFAVLHRYGSSQPIPFVQDWLLAINMGWAQELCIFMFVWMAKFGAAYGVRTGIHVGVDVLINRMSDKNRFYFIVFGLSCGALFTALVGSMGLKFIWHEGMHYATMHELFGMDVGKLSSGSTTPDLEWPTWLVYSAIPLGSYLMCFRFLQVTVSYIKTGELPHHDHGHVDGLDEEHGEMPLPPIFPQDSPHNSSTATAKQGA